MPKVKPKPKRANSPESGTRLGQRLIKAMEESKQFWRANRTG
jgi:hypothetical protein